MRELVNARERVGGVGEGRMRGERVIFGCKCRRQSRQSPTEIRAGCSGSPVPFPPMSSDNFRVGVPRTPSSRMPSQGSAVVLVGSDAAQHAADMHTRLREWRWEEERSRGVQEVTRRRVLGQGIRHAEWQCHLSAVQSSFFEEAS